VTPGDGRPCLQRPDGGTSLCSAFKPGANLHTTDYNGLNALHYAARSDEPQPVLLYLLSCGLNVNAGSHQDRTASYFAAARGMVTAVKGLLEHGADVHCTVQADSGHNVLFAAALFGQTETMEVLLCSSEGQRLLASRDSHNRTALIATAGFGKALVRDVLALLLRHCADVHAVDTGGATALHLAAGNNNTGAVQLLLQHGAAVDALVCRCVQALLDAGADVVPCQLLAGLCCTQLRKTLRHKCCSCC
jgi:ankyrin repeat protein